MKLMPQGSYRWCRLPSCERRWFTASPAAQPCPFCGLEAKDATTGWPHACTNGHSAQHGGECPQCVVEGSDKRSSKGQRRRAAL